MVCHAPDCTLGVGLSGKRAHERHGSPVFSQTPAVGSTHLSVHCTNLRRSEGSFLRHGGPGAGGRTAAGLAVSCSYLAHTTAGTERSPKFNAPKSFRSGSFGGCASPQPGVRWCHYVARERCVRGWDRYLPPSWTRGSSRPTNGH